MTPQRIQLFRRRGRTMPPNSVKVARPTIFGNPWIIEDLVRVARESGAPIDTATARDIAVESYESWLKGDPDLIGNPGWKSKREEILRRLPSLRGKNLACFCKPHERCHADVLLKLANAECEIT